MRTINIDIDNLNEQYDCGYIGEINASTLRINVSTLPSEASFYVVVFKNDYNETYLSERMQADNSYIECELHQALTKTKNETAIVEAYKETDNQIEFLAKSNLINLFFDKSISDDEAIETDGVNGLYKELITYLDDFKQKVNNGDFDGKDGTDGRDGVDGINGVDGFSPSAKVERVTNGVVITIIDKDGPTTAIVFDGQGGGSKTYFTEINGNVTFNQIETGKVYISTTDFTLSGVNSSNTLDCPANTIIFGQQDGFILVMNGYGTFCFEDSDERDWNQCYALNDYDVKDILKDILADYLKKTAINGTFVLGTSNSVAPSEFTMTYVLNSYAKKSEVEDMIESAIGNALGGSY